MGRMTIVSVTDPNIVYTISNECLSNALDLWDLNYRTHKVIWNAAYQDCKGDNTPHTSYRSITLYQMGDLFASIALKYQDCEESEKQIIISFIRYSLIVECSAERVAFLTKCKLGEYVHVRDNKASKKDKSNFRDWIKLWDDYNGNSYKDLIVLLYTCRYDRAESPTSPSWHVEDLAYCYAISKVLNDYGYVETFYREVLKWGPATDEKAERERTLLKMGYENLMKLLELSDLTHCYDRMTENLKRFSAQQPHV